MPVPLAGARRVDPAGRLAGQGHQGRAAAAPPRARAHRRTRPPAPPPWPPAPRHSSFSPASLWRRLCPAGLGCGGSRRESRRATGPRRCCRGATCRGASPMARTSSSPAGLPQRQAGPVSHRAGSGRDAQTTSKPGVLWTIGKISVGTNTPAVIQREEVSCFAQARPSKFVGGFPQSTLESASRRLQDGLPQDRDSRAMCCTR